MLFPCIHLFRWTTQYYLRASNINTMLRQYDVETIGGIPREQICELLHVILKNTYFTFESKIFHQIKGLPMGSPLSGLMAILFMDNIERQASRNINTVQILWRYVDDCFLFTKNRATAMESHGNLNSQNPHINFEIELPINEHELKSVRFHRLNI